MSIRDIRSSEKVFWRKVLEIYATILHYAQETGWIYVPHAQIRASPLEHTQNG